MGDASQRTQRLDEPALPSRRTAHATTLRPEAAGGSTLPLVEEATRAAESLPRISVSLGEAALESLRGRSESTCTSWVCLERAAWGACSWPASDRCSERLR